MARQKKQEEPLNNFSVGEIIAINMIATVGIESVATLNEKYFPGGQSAIPERRFLLPVKAEVSKKGKTVATLTILDERFANHDGTIGFAGETISVPVSKDGSLLPSPSEMSSYKFSLREYTSWTRESETVLDQWLFLNEKVHNLCRIFDMVYSEKAEQKKQFATKTPILSQEECVAFLTELSKNPSFSQSFVQKVLFENSMDVFSVPISGGAVSFLYNTLCNKEIQNQKEVSSSSPKM